MSLQTICNKCKKEITTGIHMDNNSQYDESPYYELRVRKYSCIGQLLNDKEYHLCESCDELFNEFINTKLDESNTNNGESIPLSSEELDYILKKDSDDTSNHFKCTIAHSDVNKNNRQYTSYTLGDHVTPIKDTIQIGNMLKPIKSDMVIGNVHIYNTKKFNKLEKFMWKKFFGFEIKEINNEKNN